MFGGSDGSARRSEISPWASPITAMSTITLVPEDCREMRERERESERNSSLVLISTSLLMNFRADVIPG